jgi:hypothetical protein
MRQRTPTEGVCCVRGLRGSSRWLMVRTNTYVWLCSHFPALAPLLTSVRGWCEARRPSTVVGTLSHAHTHASQLTKRQHHTRRPSSHLSLRCMHGPCAVRRHPRSIDRRHARAPRHQTRHCGCPSSVGDVAAVCAPPQHNVTTR